VVSNQEPFNRLLGSKKEQKKHLIYETGHSIPRNELIKQTLDWLDQYLGRCSRLDAFLRHFAVEVERSRS